MESRQGLPAQAVGGRISDPEDVESPFRTMRPRPLESRELVAVDLVFPRLDIQYEELAAIVRSQLVADLAVVESLAALGDLVTGETRVRHDRDLTTFGRLSRRRATRPSW
jgi:hypothetical protein